MKQKNSSKQDNQAFVANARTEKTLALPIRSYLLKVEFEPKRVGEGVGTCFTVYAMI